MLEKCVTANADMNLRKKRWISYGKGRFIFG